MFKDRSPGGLIISGLQISGISFAVSAVLAFYALGKGEADSHFETSFIGYITHGLFIIFWVLTFLGLLLTVIGIVLSIVKRIRSH